MSDPVEVFGIGSEVIIDGSITARVTAIMIRETGIQYEVVFWNERERREIWVGAWEVKPNAETLQVNQIL